MNVVKELQKRLVEARTGKAYPCKNYATEAAAEKATSEMAQATAEYFYKGPNKSEARSARYMVLYVESWGRWVGCIDLTELLLRSTSTGGYLGFSKGFFTY